MAELIFLGTANAIPDETHENTHMVLVGENQTVLIDCVNNPIIRLQQAGIAHSRITDLVVTHFHPDHVSGVPSLLMNSWLLGRKAPLCVHGLAHTLDRVEKMMDFYDWSSWPNFYPVEFHRLEQQEMALLLESPEFRIFASPVRHLIPAIGLRIESLQTGRVLAYSCDTEPCDEVVRLAKHADILIHEATGVFLGHTSAAQAGEIARQAEAGSLYLIHYNPRSDDPEELIRAAGETFSGPVYLSQDFMRLNL